MGLCVSQRTTPQWSFEEDVVFYSEAGVTGIGLWRGKLLQVDEEKASELLSGSALRPLYLDWAGGFTGTHGWSYRAAMEEAIRYINWARRWGAQIVIIHSGERGRHTFNHSRRILREALKELEPVARQNGVFLGLEPVHPADPEKLTYLQRIEEALEFVAVVGGSHVKIVYDLGHLGLDLEVLRRLDEWVKELALVQVADIRLENGEPRRVPPGKGVVPVAKILTMLREAGYSGPFDVEIWGPEVANYSPHQLLEEAKNFFQHQIFPTFNPGSAACPSPIVSSPPRWEA